MRRSRWREAAREVIMDVLAEHGEKPLDLLLPLVRAAYPFGERAGYPYSAWRKEARLILKRSLRPPYAEILATEPEEALRRARRREIRKAEAAGQKRLPKIS